MSIFFTADHHFGHANIIKFQERPFANVTEMDSELINRWNEVVGPDDTVYHLGDFTLGNMATRYFMCLNGKIKMVVPKSHHDRRWLKHERAGWVSAGGHDVELRLQIETIIVPLPDDSDKEFVSIVMCHYPFAVWEQKHYGSWHLHGHSHCHYKSCNPDDKIMDVGVDCNDFTPVSLERVWDRMLR